MILTLIGDIHCEFSKYAKICSEHENTIQLGDMGIGFQRNHLFPILDPTKHRFFAGNHDHRQECRNFPHYLGDFGIYEGIFYVSGAWSIDRHSRMEGRDWWPDEELSYRQLGEALDLYTKTKPRIVISHDCPKFVKDFMVNENCRDRTCQALQAMYEVHQPEMHFFAHHHRPFDRTFGGTRFKCLDILEYFDLDA